MALDASASGAVSASGATSASEPQAGWSVIAYHYYASDTLLGPVGDSGASCFLACDSGGNSRGLQWWSMGEPTVFHGSWTMQQGTITLRFNCRGPLHPPDAETGEVRPRRLKTTHAHRIDEGVYEGEDEMRRTVRLVRYGVWTVREGFGSKLVWVAASDPQAAGDHARKRPRE